MSNISFFCLTLNPNHEKFIKELSYIPVGLGNKNFSINCFNDNKGENISEKNPFYGEYTFHYWLWKNYLDKIDTEWVGFCQYRKFFIKNEINVKNINFEQLNESVIKKIDQKNEKFDCILGTKFSVQNYKFSKILKKYLFKFLSNPELIFNKKKRNLKFHFDLFHGEGNLETAIKFLDQKNKNDFTNFMTSNNSFHPHNMFICKTEILKEYYEVIFPWLKNCEEAFGFDNLKTYGLKRIYGFLAERFLSYWFYKNYKIKEYPILIKDLSDYKNL